MRKQISIAATAALIASIALTAPAANAADSLLGNGSSYSKNIITTCAADFKAKTGIEVTYGGAGSGTGKTDYVKGIADFAGTDSVFSSTDLAALVAKDSKFTYIPVVGGPIAIPYNVGGVSNLRLNASVIGEIFNGKISMWNDPKLVRINGSVKLPAKKITVVYRAKNSGTTNNFASYLKSNKVAGWTQNDSFEISAGTLPANKVGAQDSAGVSTGIDNNSYSIGYVDLSDAYNKDLSFASIANVYVNTKTKKKTLEYVKPSIASAQTFLALQVPAADGTVKINHTRTVKGAYSLSLLTYLIAPTNGGATSKAANVKKFVEYMLITCAPAKAKRLYYVPISGKFLDKAKALVAKIK